MAQDSSVRLSSIGTPFINTYAKENHFTSRSAYHIRQSSDGLLYIASGWGLGVFDGTSQRLINQGRRVEVYDIAFGRKGRVYTTRGLLDIGYWEPDGIGQLQRTSLREAIPEGMASSTVFRELLINKSEVIFRAREALLIYDEESEKMSHLTPKGRFGPVLRFGDKILVIDSSQGIMEYAGGTLSLYASAPEGEIIARMTRMGSEDELLVISESDQFYKLRNGALRPWKTVLDDYLPGLEVMELLNYGDDYVIVATHKNGIFIIDTEGRLIQKLNSDLGLRDSEVQAIMLDSYGDLWVSHYSGISHVILSEPFTSIDTNHGLPSAVTFDAIRHQNKYYVGTNSGLAVKDLATPWVSTSDEPLFKTIEGFNEMVYALFSTGEAMFVASRRGFYEVQGNRLRSMFKDHIIGMGAIVPDSSKLIVGDLYGVFHLIEKQNGLWANSGELPGLSRTFSGITNAGENGMWLRDHRDSVFQIGLNDNFDAVESIKKYGADQGIPQGVDLRFFVNPSGLHLATGGKGVYLYDQSTDRFEPMEAFSESLGDKYVHRFRELPDGTVLTNGPLHNKPLNKGLFVPDGEGYVNVRYPIERIAPISGQHIKAYDDEFWIGGRNITIFRPNDRREKPVDFNAKISEVRMINSADSLVYGGVGSVETSKFNPAQNAFKFTFGAAFFDETDKLEFQSYLEGTESDWSEWTSDLERTYTNLPHGAYTFKVRARNVYGNVSRIDEFSFVVITPWYLTWWAYLFYAALLIVLIRTIVQINARKLESKNIALEETVRNRTKTVQEQADKLRAIDEARSTFFTNISHELKTPLTLISTPLERLIYEGKVKDPEVLKTLATVTRNGDSLLKLVDEIMDLAKLDEGKYKLVLNPVRLNDLLRFILSGYDSAFRQRGITLEYAFELDEDLTMMLDGDRISKIINNLLSNAIKFSKPGGTISVIVGPAEKEGALLVKLKDTGSGIAEAELSRIFDRYYQTDQGRSTKGGTGIGLALSRQLAQLHDGSLTAESVKGEGSTFILELPIIEVEQETVVPLTEVENEQVKITLNETVSNYASSFDKDKPVLLVTEDHPEMREFIAQTLTPYFEVMQAENGQVALDILQRTEIDVVISDVMMPVMDGFALLDAIKSDEKLHDVSFIMLTASADEEDKLYALSMGIDDFLTKPFNASEFLARVKNILDNRTKIIKEYKTIEGLSAEEKEEELAAFIKTYDFSEREMEVLKLLARRMTNPEIAEALFISRNTVKFHMKNIFGKLGIKTRKEVFNRVGRFID